MEVLLLSIFRINTISQSVFSSVTMLRLPVLGEGVQHGNVPLDREGERGEHGPDLGGDWIVGEESEI